MTFPALKILTGTAGLSDFFTGLKDFVKLQHSGGYHSGNNIYISRSWLKTVYPLNSSSE